jgi:hypothetical protein
MEVFIVFSKTGTWLSKVLSKIGNFKYMHSSISLKEDLSIMYSFGRINPHNPFLGGFVKESIHNGVYQFSKKNEMKVYKMTISEEQAKILQEEIAQFELQSKHYHYNFLGLMFVPFKIKYVRKHHYFCSQFISELLMKIAILDQSISPEWTSPSDLIRQLDLEFVFEGFIQDYPSLELESDVDLSSYSIDQGHLK